MSNMFDRAWKFIVLYFNPVQVLLQDIPFQSLLKVTTPTEDVRRLEDNMFNVFIFIKERLNSF